LSATPTFSKNRDSVPHIALFEKAVSLEKSANLLESLLWGESILSSYISAQTRALLQKSKGYCQF
jgi:hypothetical protein